MIKINKITKKATCLGVFIGCFYLGSTYAGPEQQTDKDMHKHHHHQMGADESSSTNPRPGQDGHQAHQTFIGSLTEQDFKVTRIIAPPDGFRGNIAYSKDEKRLWIISLGPPSNTEPSTLYELDAITGDIISKAAMPFTGDFGSPVYIDGFLYQGIFPESKLYKIDVNQKDSFGKIVKVVDLPTINDLKLLNESHPYPFIEFGGVTASPTGDLILHADDVAMFITVDKDTGKLLERVPTQKAMGGITSTQERDGAFYILANSDPRGGYCALEFGSVERRSPEQKDISWLVLDGQSGNTLASVRRLDSAAFAGTIALIDYNNVDGTPYGQFTFFATGEEGILEMEWTPSFNSY